MIPVGDAVAEDRMDARERRIDSVIERYVPYLGLVIGTALTLFVIPASVEFWVPTLLLVAASAAWSYVFVTRRPALAAADRRWGAVYVVGLLVLMALLVNRSPMYGFQAFAGYVHAFSFLRGRWRWAGVGATAALAAYSQLGGGLVPITPIIVAGWAVLSIVNGVVAGGFTYFGSLSTEQSHRRREIIEQLNATNTRLSDSLAENAELHAQLLAQAREAGMLDERARLAREIHDTIAQGLTGIVTQLEAAGAADDTPDVRRRHVDTAIALARESLAEARRSVEALAPGQLAAAQLPEAIAEMGKRWAEAAGVELVVDTTGDPRPLLPELEVTLFRVAQEALANVGRHAGATRAGLTVSYMDDVVVLDVRDDGQGFVPGAGSGFGLAAMEQRVRRVSGTLTVESAPGEGAALSASVPAIPAEVGS